ncbi:hypothetical protein T484DRAFT_1911918, partial [Baffinella frigidus]
VARSRRPTLRSSSSSENSTRCCNRRNACSSSTSSRNNRRRRSSWCTCTSNTSSTSRTSNRSNNNRNRISSSSSSSIPTRLYTPRRAPGTWPQAAARSRTCRAARVRRRALRCRGDQIRGARSVRRTRQRLLAP